MSATTSPSAPLSPEPPSGGPGIVSHGWLAANSVFEQADERKLGRAFSVSFGLHAALFVALVLGIWVPASQIIDAPREKYDLVFLQVPGPGGGGGGGGNKSPEPPRKMEVKAEAPKPAVVEAVKVDVPKPPPELIAPIQTAPVVIQNVGVMVGLSAAPSQGTGISGGAGTGAGTGSGPGRGAGLGDGYGGGFGGGAMRSGSGVQDPTLLKKVEPRYTPEAMRAKIQGVVELEAVVGTNGLITDIRVVKSLDRSFGLDEEAMKTAKQWLFRPGRFKGEAVNVLVVIQMEFRLH